MNRAARTFEQLEQLFHVDASSPQVEVLAADLAAQAAHGRRLIDIRPKTSVCKLYGLVFLLDGYGLILSQKYRKHDDQVYVWLELKRNNVSEFAGAVVVEKSVEPVQGVAA